MRQVWPLGSVNPAHIGERFWAPPNAIMNFGLHTKRTLVSAVMNLRVP